MNNHLIKPVITEVGIIGLGYVGLTLATVMAETGISVVGIERQDEIVKLTNEGKPHFEEVGLSQALKKVISAGSLKAYNEFPKHISCRNYIITVGTPLNEKGKARLDMIKKATKEVANNMQDGSLVILRSTVKIGTASNIVLPILKKTGKEFSLAMCPERTLEGNALRELKSLPQIIGASDDLSLNKAAKLFGLLTNTLVKVPSLETAEILKLVDNTYRDVQFGFANEIARLCEAFGVNASEIIRVGKLGYPRTNVSFPGLVGGPCLSKDPHILAESAQEKNLKLEITQASRLVNERQPIETVDFIIKEMNRRGFLMNEEISIMGIAFKGIPETNDLRGSMSIRVIEEIQKRAPLLKISLFDSIVSKKDLLKIFPSLQINSSINEAIKKKSVLIITNNHPIFQNYKPEYLISKMKNEGFIYDYWNNFSSLDDSELSNYFATGNTKDIR